ncbi:peptidoglycan-binding protein [Streptomyces sp. NPDC046915]|uniref:peptidoglycan-binding domain-containing protein n=1 Tax=Streptomyces sp. NPDC046915 TaxID=3155257 RepID=UPI0033DD66DD
MRAGFLTRALVSTTAVVGIAAGSLAGAATSFAASAPASKAMVSSRAVVPLAVVNLGLSTKQAKGLQCWLSDHDWGYTGPIDGLLGTESWMAMQRYLNYFDLYHGHIDGIVGSGTIEGLQILLRGYGYTGPIDGIAGSGTEAAFGRFADDKGEECVSSHV